MSYQRARDDLKFVDRIATLCADSFVDVYLKPSNWDECYALVEDKDALHEFEVCMVENGLYVKQLGEFYPVRLIVRRYDR